MSRLRWLAVLLFILASTRALIAQDVISVLKIGPVNSVPGRNVAFTVTVHSTDAMNPAANVQLNDTVPAHTTFVSAVQNSGPAFNPCTTPAVGSSTGTITCTIASFPAGGPDAVFTFTFHVQSVSSSTPGTTNTATVTTTTPDNPANNTSSATTNFTPEADLSISKSAPATVFAGANITYTLTVSNAGPSDSQGVQFSDPMFGSFVSFSQTSGVAFTCMLPPVGSTATSVICNTATLPAGATATFQLVERVPPDAVGSFFNQGTVTSGTFDPGPSPNFVNTSTLIYHDADLAVSKTGPLTATAGQAITYTITATNNGPSEASNANLTDSLPATLTFDSITQTAGPSTACVVPPVGSSGVVSCDWFTFAAGASATFRLVAHVVPNAANGSSIANTATISWPTFPPSTQDSNPLNNSSTATTTVSTLVDLTVTKTAGAATVNPGNNITYTVTLSNGGPSNAASVALTDVVPTGTTFVSETHPAGWACTAPAPGATGTINCTVASLAPGASATFTIVVNNNTSNLGGTNISNTAQVSSATAETTLANNSSTANVTVTAAGLAVTKSDSPDPVQAGTNITYTVTVSNLGTVGAHDVVLTDAIPANTTFVSEMQTSGPAFTCMNPAVGGSGTITCTNVFLNAATSAVFQIAVRVNPGTANGTTITNSASGTMSDVDPNPSDNTGTTTTTVAVTSDIRVTKTGPPSVPLAGNITYNVSISNSGTSDAQTVTLTDVVPTGTTFVSETQTSGPAFGCTTPAAGGTGTISCSIATLGAGATSTFDIVVAVNAGAGTTITNTATGSSASADANGANNSASVSTVVAGPDLAVTKSDSPDPVVAGSNITYTITVTNNGTAGANNVSLSDAVPANTTFVSEAQTAGPAFMCTNPPVGGTGTVNCTLALLGPATSATFQIVVQVGAGTANGTIISNTATATTTDPEANTTNNSATTTTTVSITTVADLVVTKSDAPDPVTAGSTVTYTITVTNSGTASAASVSLTDVVPANTTFFSFSAPVGWMTSTPAVGGTGTVTATNPLFAPGPPATFTLVVTANGGLAAGTIISNTATVATSTPESSTANNSATATTTVAVTTLPDLVVTKSDAPDPVAAGSTITYTITVTNSGTASAGSVSLTDSVPANTTFAAFTAPAGWMTSTPGVGGTGTVTATNALVAPAAPATFTLVVTVNGGVAAGTTITNTATVATPTTESSTANNTATATTTVGSGTTADLSITKTPNAAAVGLNGQITYTITVTNGGAATANGVSVSDTLPGGTTFVSATPSQGSCSGTSTVVCSLGSLSNGSSATVTLIVTAPATPASVINTATVSSTTADPNSANNSATTTVSVVAGIPALEPFVLLLLALALAAAGLFARPS